MRNFLLKGLLSRPLSEAVPELSDEISGEFEALEVLGGALRKSLGRSLALRLVDAGSCNGCELELQALGNPIYDLERFGLKFVASPRHADVLLVSGPVTSNMEVALRRTYDAMPAPKWVVAVGDCARDGGCFSGSYAVVGGVDKVLPVDLFIAGCPPNPHALLRGLMGLVERAQGAKKRGVTRARSWW